MITQRHRFFPTARVRAYLAMLLIVVLSVAALGQQPTYQKPSNAILDVFNAPPTPNVSISPTHDYMLLTTATRYPTIAESAEPMLRIGGLRIDPDYNGRHLAPRINALTLKAVPAGKETKIVLPPNPRLSQPAWAPDGKHFAFTNTTPTGIELWVGTTTSATVRRIPGMKINAAYGQAMEWMPDNKTLLCQLIPAGRGRPPAEPKVPAGPHIQESYGKAVNTPTYEDLLQNAHDEDLFDYYTTSQLAVVNIATGLAAPIGKPAIIVSSDPSPDGQHFIVTTNHKPYSYLVPSGSFPKEVEVWDRHGKVEHKIASIPLSEGRPQGAGPANGPDQGLDENALNRPRNYQWRPTEAATLTWVESFRDPNANGNGELEQGRGQRGNQAGNQGANRRATRDRLMAIKAPFQGNPTEMYKPEGQNRFGGVTWGEKGWALVRETEPQQNRGGQGNGEPSDMEQGRGGGQGFGRGGGPGRTLLVNFDNAAQKPRVIIDRPAAQQNQNRYNDPGTPVMRELPNGRRVFLQNGNNIFLASNGPTPEGDRPFLDRFDLTTLKSERLFRCDDKSYESFVAFLNEDGSRFITRYETPTEPPNYYVRSAGAADKQALTKFTDPTPQVRAISKQLVKYKRADGVDLNFTLYLPPDYKQGTRLPTVVWAYPREFEDADSAGTVTGSQFRFTTISGMSQLFFALAGYAVLDNAAMPVVATGGNMRTVNDTFVDQIVADAKAAIDKAVEMGVTDRNRVGVGGHSYGAFMTANLLAHSDLFRAGIARSGAYNRSLTPFGFQNERRNYWEAPETYLKMSPFMFADKLKLPILLIHGEADDNSGTFPIQSERFYQALKGNGGNVRYVTLPFEPHGYQSKESLEHVLWEMTTWFDKYVKNATDTPAAATASSKGEKQQDKQ